MFMVVIIKMLGLRGQIFLDQRVMVYASTKVSVVMAHKVN